MCRGYLRLAARPKRHPPKAALYIAEPTMLYESAFHILDENKCTLHGVVVWAPKCGAPQPLKSR